MSAVEYVVPCFEFSRTCRLDWSGISALGGWAAAIGTLVAVAVALSASRSQLSAAERAMHAEREKALEIQQREWDAAAEASKLMAMRLAHGFSRELSYARRSIFAGIADWDPKGLIDPPKFILDIFVRDKPLPDLMLIGQFADRLEGFEDEDAFAILSVLATWQFFNANPGISAEQLALFTPEQRQSMARSRVKFAFELLDLIEHVINRLEPYYSAHPSIVRYMAQELPNEVKAAVARMREEAGIKPSAQPHG